MDGPERKFKLLYVSTNFGNDWDHSKVVDLGIGDSFLTHEHRIV